MDDTMKSIVSVQSVAIQSKISLISVAAQSTMTQTSLTSPATSIPRTSSATIFTLTSVTSLRRSSSPKSSSTMRKGTHSATPSNSPSGNGGVPAPVIAVIVVLLVAAALVGVWFLFQWRKNRHRRAKSGLWLENGKYLDQMRTQSDEGKVASPYVFGGMGSSDAHKPGSTHEALPPVSPPPPVMSDKGSMVSGGTGQHAPVPHTPAMVSTVPSSADPFAKLAPSPVPSAMNAQAHSRSPSPLPPVPSPYVPRPDSGPVLLYSTPKSAHEASGPQTAATAMPAMHTTSPLMVPAPAANAPMPPPPYVAQTAKSNTASFLHLPPVPIEPLALSSVSDPLASPQPQSPTVPDLALQQEQGSQPDKMFVVVRTYVPALLDELNVNVGDLVRVINEFDDGWAYCEMVGNEDGYAGVVPLECLDRSAKIGRPVSRNLGVPMLKGPPMLPRRSSRCSSFNVDFDNVRANPTW
ncbi:uncharacterized protein EI90DRAFT_2669586 [Cantharellus anzutake]|uniref:uncharacterized protein n=1 Tax=Cantharellus anzutake TaxID=1750568 RepID=UPI0019074292|nr:uncharacterized protein EI90DRAFT_2669586 [Cantharellus anzutake]KAF8337597.1 hypothetical protein EI90DRAFT_2669586 [Cantharellus anzutake]